MVDTCACASSVAFSPSRRSALTSRYAIAERYSRNWLARIVSALTRSANRLNCSLMRFSMSPRAQYRSSQRLCRPLLSRQRGDHKTRILLAINVFGLGPFSVLVVPSSLVPLSGAIREVRKHARRLACPLPLLPGLPQRLADDSP